MIDYYLCIEPSGDLRWISVPRLPNNETLRREKFSSAIGCDWLENVYTRLPNICLVVDECGKIKQIPQLPNFLASRLYAGAPFGDLIHGPAVVCAMHPVNEIGEMDWVPLTAGELSVLSLYLGIEIPDIN